MVAAAGTLLLVDDDRSILSTLRRLLELEGYAVATAGGKAVGRSKMAHIFHGSEVAFWPNAKKHIEQRTVRKRVMA